MASDVSSFYSQPRASCLYRIRQDVTELLGDVTSGMTITPDDCSIRILHLLIVGISDDNVKGGLFYFLILFPEDYPDSSPTIKLMTKDDSFVGTFTNSFGRVYLDILEDGLKRLNAETTNSLKSLLLRLRSMLQDELFLKSLPHIPSDMMRLIVLHETLRLTVVEQMMSRQLRNAPSLLTDSLDIAFLENYGYYKRIGQNHLYLDGRCPDLLDKACSPIQGCFNFRWLLKQVEMLYKEKISVESSLTY